MNTTDLIGIIGTITTVIGIIVGIIGLKSLNKANQLTAQTVSASTLAQGENVTIINQGTDTYAIMKIAKDVTQAELSAIVAKFAELQGEIAAVRQDVDSMPKIHYGTEEPQAPKYGDIWFEIR